MVNKKKQSSNKKQPQRNRWLFIIGGSILFATVLIVISVILGFWNKKDNKVLIDEKTNKDTAYSMEILHQDDIKNDKVLSWLNDCIAKQEDNEKYFTLKNMNSEGLDLYLYMPKAQEIIGDITLSNVKAKESGTALKLVVETDGNIKHTRMSTDLILHVYVTNPAEETPVKSEMLVINGTIYFCATATSKSW